VVDIMTATCGRDQSLVARVVVRSRLSAIPGHWNEARNDVADLEELGVEILEQHGAQISGSRRTEMLGSQATETSGFVEAERISVRLLYHGRHVFQFLCVGGEGTNWKIHLQAADLSSLPVVPDAASFAARMAQHLESKGSTVSLKKGELAGMPCHHLQATLRNGFRDVFVLNHDDINYALLVDQPTRDQKLIEKAKRGFRLSAR
jgi:hypothetical protein